MQIRGLIIFSALTLAGCAGPVKEARLEYQDSAERYKACVAAKGPSGCETERVIMETDERKYTNIGSSVNGNSNSSNVTVQRRGWT
jgi:hypothetical protein